MRTVAAVFSSLAEAERVARHLETLGVPRDAISVIAGNDVNRHDKYLEKAKKESTGTAVAAASGASFGGGLGILAGLAVLAIPGVGPVIAGGGMTAILTGLGIGAAAGALIGAFRNMGIPHDEAALYEEAVRRGLVVVAATVDDEMEPEVLRVMDEEGARDLQADVEAWRASGWKHPYPSDSSMAAHEPPEKIEITANRSQSWPYSPS